MRDRSSQPHDLARRLLDHETGGSRDPADMAEGLGRVWEKLYELLAPLIGPGGFSAIAMRALREAQADFPMLSGIGLLPGAHAPSAGLHASVRGQNPSEVSAALIALLGGFLESLFSLLGRGLPLRLLKSAWPGVGFENGSPVPGK